MSIHTDDPVAGTIPGPTLNPMEALSRDWGQRDRAADIKTAANLLLDEERNTYREYVRLLAREKELERNRGAAKLSAALRLMETINPLNGEKQARYSGTAAWDTVTLDHEYWAYLTTLDEITVLRIAACEKLQSVRNEIALFLAGLKMEAGFLP